MIFLMATPLTNEEILAALRGKTKVKTTMKEMRNICIHAAAWFWCERKPAD